eukprot:COSAG01_NODE_21704_length_889_cov_1.327848_1_plen_167_part_10
MPVWLISVKDCNVAVAHPSGGVYGELVLDVCGADQCSGKASEWIAKLAPATGGSVFKSKLSSGSKCFAINAVGGASGGLDDEHQIVAWGFDKPRESTYSPHFATLLSVLRAATGKTATGNPDNSEFHFDEATDHIKIVGSNRVSCVGICIHKFCYSAVGRSSTCAHH